MSAEVVKKRGRPKKVILDPAELELLQTMGKNATTRAKSTNARSATTTAKASIEKPVAAKPVVSSPPAMIRPAQKPAVKPASKATPPPQPQKSSPKPATAPASSPPKAPQPVSKPADTPVQQRRSILKPAVSTPPPVSASKPAQAVLKPSASASPSKPSQPTRPSKSTPITPENSKILSQVRDLSKTPPPQPPQPSAIPSKAPAPTMPAPLSTTSVSRPAAAKIPIVALNSQIVQTIAGRAGARPNAGGKGNALPPNYKPIARKVTMAIVALPIAIVTSWVLYQRFVLGEERKLLLPAPTIEDGKKAADSVPAS